MSPGEHKNASAPSAKEELGTEARVHVSAVGGLVRISDIVDPMFAYLEVRIPERIEKTFKDVDEIKFIYLITRDDCIEIVDLRRNETLFKAFVADFDVFDFARPPITDLSFIFNRDRYKAMVKESLNKKYKESLGSSANFAGHDQFASLKKGYLEYQLEHGVNFVFIRDGPCLHAHIRSVVSLLGKRDQYIPKVKKSSTRDEYLKRILMCVPGVSESMAQAILSRHGTLESIQCGLRDRKNFCSLKIFDAAGTSHRTIQDRVYRRLFNTFMSEDPNAKI